MLMDRADDLSRKECTDILPVFNIIQTLDSELDDVFGLFLLSIESKSDLTNGGGNRFDQFGVLVDFMVLSLLEHSISGGHEFLDLVSLDRGSKVWIDLMSLLVVSSGGLVMLKIILDSTSVEVEVRVGVVLVLALLRLSVGLEGIIEMLISVGVDEITSEVRVSKDVPGVRVCDIQSHSLVGKIDTLLLDLDSIFNGESRLLSDNHGEVSESRLVLVTCLAVAHDRVLVILLLPVHMTKGIKRIIPARPKLDGLGEKLFSLSLHLGLAREIKSLSL